MLPSTSEDNTPSCKASVIIPVYNTAEFLPACLDSVLAQTLSDFEVILIDDGSIDGSLEIERAYVESDARFRMIEQPHRRQGAARNRGLAEAHGEFIFFMDSDDIIKPELLEVCCTQCAEDNLDFVVFDGARFIASADDAVQNTDNVTRDRRGECPEGIVTGEAFWTECFPKDRLPLVCWLQLFRKTFLIDNHLLYCEDVFYEDCDWTLRIYMHARRVKYLPLTLYCYRARTGSVVNSLLSETHAASCFKVYRILYGLLEAASPSQAAMIREASDQLDFLLPRFREFEPSNGFIDQTYAFGDDLAKTIGDPSTGSLERSMKARTLLSLCEGTATWPISRFALPSRVVPELMFPGILPALASGSASIYGTGNICAHLVRYLDEQMLPQFFIDSKAVDGRTFMGRPVKPISEVGSLGLSSIITASTYHYAKMGEAVKRSVPSASLILPDVHMIDALLQHIEAGTIRIES